jgi:diacylglycerol kinase family enzyme
VTTLLAVLADEHLNVAPRLEIVGQGRAALVLVANGRPYTYAGRVPMIVSRAVEFDHGLDFVAPIALTPFSTPRMLLRAFRGTLPDASGVIAGHDVGSLEVRCDRPLPLQADGEDLGDVMQAIFEAEPDALSVLA